MSGCFCTLIGLGVIVIGSLRFVISLDQLHGRMWHHMFAKLFQLNLIGGDLLINMIEDIF